MKTNQNQKSGQGFSKAFILASLMLVTSLSAFANVNDEKEPKFKAVVFKKQNTMIFKAIAKELSGAKITVKIKNKNGDLFYDENYFKKETYNRNFDVSTLAEGEYVFEITSKNEIYEQKFVITSGNIKVIVVK